MFSVTADYFQENCHVAGTGGMEARIKAPVPCSTCFCTNTSRQKEHCRIVWVLPECIQQRLHSFEHQWEEGTKNKMRAAQGRFPPPSFSWATALRTQVHSPSNPSSASSCTQSTEPMVHKPLSDCANAHSWQKQRTGREPVKLKGSLTPYNPVTNTCHHNLCIPDNWNTKPTRTDRYGYDRFWVRHCIFNWATSQFLNLQCLLHCCSLHCKG